MTCKSIRRTLSQIMDGEFGQDQAANIDEHLQGCLECSSWFEKVKLADSLYSKTEAPSYLDARIMAKIDNKDTAEAGWGKNFFINNIAPVMVLCVVGVAVLYVIWSIVATQGMGNLALSGLHSYGDGDAKTKSGSQLQKDSSSVRADSRKSAKTTLGQNQKIIRSATLRIQVKKGTAKVKLQSLIEMTERFGGYTVDSDLLSEKGLNKATTKLRIPEQAFNNAIKSISTLGTLKNMKQSGKDVTDEYVDLQARLNQIKASETAYLKLYGRAANMNDLLKIREKISDVQIEAEQLQAHIAKLDEQMAFATIDVILQDKNLENVSMLSVLWAKNKPVETGLAGFVTLASFIIIISITALPLLLIVFACFLAWRFFVNRSIKN